MRWLESAYPDRARGWVGFNVPMSHKITAGCDLLLMPSRFEPCGLNQLYAMRYGTVPVAHATGGLRDTVLPFNPWEGACLRHRGLMYCASCHHGSCAAPEGHAEMLSGSDPAAKPSAVQPAAGPRAGSKFPSGGVTCLRPSGLPSVRLPTSLPAGSGTGWTFAPCTVEAFNVALQNSLDTFHEHGSSFKDLQIRGMNRDSSWDKAAQE